MSEQEKIKIGIPQAKVDDKDKVQNLSPNAASWWTTLLYFENQERVDGPSSIQTDALVQFPREALGSVLGPEQPVLAAKPSTANSPATCTPAALVSLSNR